MCNSTHPSKQIYSVVLDKHSFCVTYFICLYTIAHREMKLKSLALLGAVHAAEQPDLSEIDINEPIRVKASLLFYFLGIK